MVLLLFLMLLMLCSALDYPHQLVVVKSCALRMYVRCRMLIVFIGCELCDLINHTGVDVCLFVSASSVAKNIEKEEKNQLKFGYKPNVVVIYIFILYLKTSIHCRYTSCSIWN